MSDHSLTLKDLLPSREKVDTKEMNLAGLKNTTPSLLGFIGGKVEEVVEASLDADVLGLIAHAWAKVNALREAAEESREKHIVKYVFLGEHELESEAQVKVLVEASLLPGVATAAAPVTDALTVKIAAKFESVGLTIDNGYIVAVEAGRANAKAELRYSNDKVFGSSSKWMALPGKFRPSPPVLVCHASTKAEIAPSTAATAVAEAA